jgi:hypothetical protein
MPKIDLVYDKDGDNLRLTHRNGQPYPRIER